MYKIKLEYNMVVSDVIHVFNFRKKAKFFLALTSERTEGKYEFDNTNVRRFKNTSVC